MEPDPRRQLIRRGRHRVRAEKGPHPSLFEDEEIPLRGGELVLPIGLMGDQEGIGQRVVDPGRVAGIGGVIGQAPARHPGDHPVDAAHLGHRGFDLGHGPVGGGGDVGGGPGEASQGILPITGVIADPGHNFWMRRLEEQRPDPPDEGRNVGQHQP